MYVFERLVGVAVFSFVLVVICLSLIGKSSRQIKKILIVYTLILTVFAYFYIPYETADLYRINELVDSFSKLSFSKFIAKQKALGDRGIANVLYWLIGKTGVPQLLPAIVTFVCYSCIFYIISKTAEKNQISGKNVAITLFFYMSIGNYMFVIAGIRCMLGISLLAFCFFRENVEGKFNLLHLPLYFISAFVHPFAAVLIAARFIVSIFDTKSTTVKKRIYFFILGVGIILATYFLDGYLDEIVKKAKSYLRGDGYSYLWEYVLAILACFVMLSALLKGKDIIAKSKLKLNVWILYEIALFIVALFVCYEFTTFHRLTTYIMPIIALPLLMTVLQSIDDKKKLGQTSSSGMIIDFGSCIMLVSILLLFIACFRGSLCSFKFFIS